MLLTPKNEFSDDPNLTEHNSELIHAFNKRELRYNGDDTNKRGGLFVGTLGLKDGSIIETPELSISFTVKKLVASVKNGFTNALREAKLLELDEAYQSVTVDGLQYMKIVVTLTNKTDKYVFVDLANSFVILDGNASPYYVPTATTSTQGTTSGGSINMGGIANAVGIGGSLGSIANGVTVGGASTNMNSTTTFSQRIVSIPPHSKLSLTPQDMGAGYDRRGVLDSQKQLIKSVADNMIAGGNAKETKKYYVINAYNMKRGETFNFEPPMDNNPLSVHITYAMDEQISATRSLRADFFVKQLMVTEFKGTWGRPDFSILDTSESPLMFFETGYDKKK